MALPMAMIVLTLGNAIANIRVIFAYCYQGMRVFYHYIDPNQSSTSHEEVHYVVDCHMYKALPMTSSCASPLPGFESWLGLVRKLFGGGFDQLCWFPSPFTTV